MDVTEKSVSRFSVEFVGKIQKWELVGKLEIGVGGFSVSYWLLSPSQYDKTALGQMYRIGRICLIHFSLY